MWNEIYMCFAKGQWGEMLVRVSLGFLPKRTYHVLNDVTIEVLDGTMQIDHIVVSRFGVFVIETKNLSGKIYGRPGDKSWTQCFSRTAKFKFQNPVHQNYRHIKSLEELTGLGESVHHSIVCFIGSAAFKHDLPREVERGLPILRILTTRKNVLLSEKEIRSYVSILTLTALPRTLQTQQQHISSLSSRKQTT